MSQFVSVETVFNDSEVLVNALKKLYPKVEQGRNIKLYNYAGNVLGQTADIVVRRIYVGNERLSNDIGFAYDNVSETYRLAVGDYDMNTHKFDLGNLENLYTEMKTIKELQNRGYRIIKHQRIDNKTVTLKVERWK